MQKPRSTGIWFKWNEDERRRATGNEPFAFNPAIRRDYLNLSRDLSALTRSFGISLTPEYQRDAAALVFAIECTDRSLDAIADAIERARFAASVGARLQGSNYSMENLTYELAARLDALKEIGERRGVHARLCETVRDLFENSEHMRNARTPGWFIDCAVKEGRLMVELLLLILAPVSNPRFDAFMRQLAGPANLVDKLRDARSDFQNGEIALKPTLLFHLNLLNELSLRTARLACGNILNWRLAAWGARSLFTELAWYFVSKTHSYIGKRPAYAIVPCDRDNECVQTMGW